LGEDEEEGFEGGGVRGGHEMERRAPVLDQLRHDVQPASRPFVSATRVIHTVTQRLMPAREYYTLRRDGSRQHAHSSH